MTGIAGASETGPDKSAAVGEELQRASAMGGAGLPKATLPENDLELAALLGLLDSDTIKVGNWVMMVVENKFDLPTYKKSIMNQFSPSDELDEMSKFSKRPYPTRFCPRSKSPSPRAVVSVDSSATALMQVLTSQFRRLQVRKVKMDKYFPTLLLRSVDDAHSLYSLVIIPYSVKFVCKSI